MLRKRSCSIDSELNSTKKSKVLSNKTNILLSPPVTPKKKRVIDFNIKKDDDKAVKNLFPSPPSTPTKPKSNVYLQTKAIFQRGYQLKDSNCEYLVGREVEAKEINHFIKSNIMNQTCDSLYISGPPGSGKTAQLDLSIGQYVTKEPKSTTIAINDKKCKIIKINCMILMNPNEIFKQICNEMKIKNNLYEVLADGYEDYSSIMIILDEIDYLLTKDQNILVELFNLSSRNLSPKLKTKCMMIGIANSLDLTNKLLPKLDKNGTNPKVVSFKPYSFDKMKSIVTQKLKSLIELDKENIQENFIPIVNASAILLCCKKIASTTGDLRKCFDVLYKSIELLEQELKSKNHQELFRYDLMTAPKVSIAHIAKICNLDYGNNILIKLTYIQRIVMVYLLRFENDSSITCEPIVNSFYEYYRSVELSSNNLTKVNRSEFLEIITNLESLSIVKLSDNKNIGLKYIQSNVNYQDFKKSISSINQLKYLLE